MSRPSDIVLVVDDSPATLGMLNEALEKAGYTVLVAQSGAAALTLVQRVTPDLVLMDALMPGLDGFETCRRMKRNPMLRAVPIVFMTGLTETEHVLHGLDAGGVDYVSKPVTPDEVIARIRVHLANARLTRSAQIALDTAGRFLLAASLDGRILWSTPQASRLIEQANGAAEIALPAAVTQWLRSFADTPPANRQASLTVAFREDGMRRLLVTCIGQIGPDEHLLRVAAEQTNSDEVLLRERLSVTLREAEVLLWVSRGKSNRDIAEILGLSPRTVNKHLEQMFEKLGVENRASATALALRTLQDTAG
jgi:DNA-binding response OmpR family regulator/DNA-binding CsgD family transcriptional regulator